MKKTFSIIIALIMIFTALTGLNAFAAEDTVVAKGTGGEGITWTLTEGGVLTVSGKGPIVDDIFVEEYDDGSWSTQVLDSIDFQLSDYFNEATDGMSIEERENFRYSYVKTLIIEEGITEIPENEFINIYPGTIVLPSTLENIANRAVNGIFAESLTVNSKALQINGGVTIAGYDDGAQPFASLKEAKSAAVTAEVETTKLSEKIDKVYDLQTAYSITKDIDVDLTAEELIEILNERYGTEFANLDDVIAYCVAAANELFETNYESADEIVTVTEDEFGTSVELIPELNDRVTEMYDSVSIYDRLSTSEIGTEANEYFKLYNWTTVYGPSGSDTESCAKLSGLKFVPTDEEEPQDDSFMGKVKAFFNKIIEFFKNIFEKIKSLFA